MFFEDIKVFNRKIYNLEYHEASIKNTIKMMPKFDINQELSNIEDDGVLKAIISYNQKGELTDKKIIPYMKRNIKSFTFIEANNLKYDFKYTKKTPISDLLEGANSDDIIIIKNGFITDTSDSNIAILLGRKWVTPRNPLIYGTTRARLLKRNLIVEKDITKDDILHSKGFAILNAMDDFRIIENPEFIDKNLDIDINEEEKID